MRTLPLILLIALAGCKTAPKVVVMPPVPVDSVSKPRAKALIVPPEIQYKLVWNASQNADGYEVWKSYDVALGIGGFELWQTVTTNECSLMPLEPFAFFICRAYNTNGVSDWNK